MNVVVPNHVVLRIDPQSIMPAIGELVVFDQIFPTAITFPGSRTNIECDAATKSSWNTIAQWDTVSDEMGIQSRIRWIVTLPTDPG